MPGPEVCVDDDYNQFPLGDGGFSVDDPTEQLRTYLVAREFSPEPVDGQPAFRFYVRGDNGVMVGFAALVLSTQQFLFYASCPQRAPMDRLAEVAEFVTRANWGLRIGNFEMDYSDGEVRMKASFDYEASGLPEKMLQNTIGPAVHTMDAYLPGLLKVMMGGATAADAIREIEGP